MKILSNFPHRMILLIIISNEFLSVTSKSQDDLCPKILGVLCVKDVLVNILVASQTINQIAKDIEQTIYQEELTPSSLNDYIEHHLKSLRTKLPFEQHYQLIHVENNVNRSGLIKLIEEEHYAFSYLYNSIQNILRKEKTFGSSTEKSFIEISNSLSKNVLCNYRRILQLYSINWLSLNDINRVQILHTRARIAPSFLHHSYSIIVVRLLQEWSKYVQDFVGNIDGKYI